VTGWRFLAFTAPNFILLAVFTFWPVAYSLYLSFYRWNMIAPTKRFIGFENYTRMVADPIFWQVLRNTAVLAVGTVFIKLAIALFLAISVEPEAPGPERLSGHHLLAYFHDERCHRHGVGLDLWTRITDCSSCPYAGWGCHRLTGWQIQLALPAVMIVVIWAGIGYDMVIFLAGLQAISADLYEAARVDGASRWSLFRHVTFPLLSPTTFFLLIISIVGAFKAFDIVAVMTGGGPLNSSNVYVYYLYQNAFRWFKTGYASALAVVLFVIILVITIMPVRLSRRWVHY
jgi:ABC-type sugar transport system permease subunit